MRISVVEVVRQQNQVRQTITVDVFEEVIYGLVRVPIRVQVLEGHGVPVPESIAYPGKDRRVHRRVCVISIKNNAHYIDIRYAVAIQITDCQTSESSYEQDPQHCGCKHWSDP